MTEEVRQPQEGQRVGGDRVPPPAVRAGPASCGVRWGDPAGVAVVVGYACIRRSA